MHQHFLYGPEPRIYIELKENFFSTYAHEYMSAWGYYAIITSTLVIISGVLMVILWQPRYKEVSVEGEIV